MLPRGVVKVHTINRGQTFGADEDLLTQLRTGLRVKQTSQQDSDVIIVFCPISSRVGSDVEAAMREVSESARDKKIILVLMHHTRDVDYSAGGRRWSETFRNVVLDVDVLFHETVPGLLNCRENMAAVKQIQDLLDQYSTRLTIKFIVWILFLLLLLLTIYYYCYHDDVVHRDPAQDKTGKENELLNG